MKTFQTFIVIEFYFFNVSRSERKIKSSEYRTSKNKLQYWTLWKHVLFKDSQFSIRKNDSPLRHFQDARVGCPKYSWMFCSKYLNITFILFFVYKKPLFTPFVKKRKWILNENLKKRKIRFFNFVYAYHSKEKKVKIKIE